MRRQAEEEVSRFWVLPLTSLLPWSIGIIEGSGDLRKDLRAATTCGQNTALKRRTGDDFLNLFFTQLCDDGLILNGAQGQMSHDLTVKN
jgi:hypothetical protein